MIFHFFLQHEISVPDTNAIFAVTVIIQCVILLNGMNEC
jgi:hypothetical protein